jgi:hypothetical protein
MNPVLIEWGKRSRYLGVKGMTAFRDARPGCELQGVGSIGVNPGAGPADRDRESRTSQTRMIVDFWSSVSDGWSAAVADGRRSPIEGGDQKEEA